MREHGNFNGFHTFAPGVSRRFLLAAIDLYFGRLLFSLWSKAGTGKMCEAFKQRSIDNRKKSLRVTNHGLSLSKSQPENLIADASCSAHEGLQTRGALSHVSHVSHMAPRPQKFFFFFGISNSLCIWNSQLLKDWLRRGFRTGCERQCRRPERIRRLRCLRTAAEWLCCVGCSEKSRKLNRFSEKPFAKKRSGLGDSYSGYGAPYMPAAQEQCKTK